MTITSTDDAVAIERLVGAVDQAAALLAVAGRLAGPAAPQDDAEGLVPDDAAVGAWADLADGSVVVAFIVPDVVEADGGSPDGPGAVAALTPALTALAASAGSSIGSIQPMGSPADLPAAANPDDSRVLVGAGVFEGDRVTASIAIASPVGADDAGGAGGPGGADSGSPSGASSSPSSGSRSIAGEANIGLLAGVELGVSAELGRSTVSMGQLLDLRPGSVIELDRAAGSPVDVLVNGTLIGRGEVIVVEDEYAVRITEIVTDGSDR